MKRCSGSFGFVSSAAQGDASTTTHEEEEKAEHDVCDGDETEREQIRHSITIQFALFSRIEGDKIEPFVDPNRSCDEPSEQKTVEDSVEWVGIHVLFRIRRRPAVFSSLFRSVVEIRDGFNQTKHTAHNQIYGDVGLYGTVVDIH